MQEETLFLNSETKHINFELNLKKKKKKKKLINWRKKYSFKTTFKKSVYTVIRVTSHLKLSPFFNDSSLSY